MRFSVKATAENKQAKTPSPQTSKGKASEGRVFLSGVVVLTLSTVLVKLIGLFYKIPMLHYLGSEGMGYFNAAYEWYATLCIISTSGLPLASSMLIARAVAVGARADLILVDLNAINNIPCYDLATTLAYSANTSNVLLTMCDGRILYENGAYTTIDIECLKFESRQVIRRYFD